MGYGDYNNKIDFTKLAYSTPTDKATGKKQVAGGLGYIDFSAKEEATKLSQMDPAKMMEYLNNLSADKKIAVGKELLNMVKDPAMKAELNKMLSLLPKETAAKVSKYTTQKAIDSISKGYETTVMPGMQLAENGAIAANLTSVQDGDILGAEFSKMFQAIA